MQGKARGDGAQGPEGALPPPGEQGTALRPLTLHGLDRTQGPGFGMGLGSWSSRACGRSPCCSLTCIWHMVTEHPHPGPAGGHGSLQGEAAPEVRGQVTSPTGAHPSTSLAFSFFTRK